MIRRTITAMTFTAIATISVVAATPVLAAPPSSEPAPTAETTETPSGDTCVIETEIGSLPCLDFGWLWDAGSETDDSIDVGGVSTDAPIETVVPEDDEPAAAGLIDLVEIDRGALEDALGDALFDSPAADAEPDTAPAPATPAAPASTATADADVEPDHGTTSVEQSPDTDEAAQQPNAADEAGPEPETAALMDNPASNGGFDPATAGLAGALAALVLAGATFGAYKFGKRGA